MLEQAWLIHFKRREVKVYVFDEVCRLILSSLRDNLCEKKLLSSIWACMIYIFSWSRAIWFIQGIFIWITKLEQNISIYICIGLIPKYILQLFSKKTKAHIRNVCHEKVRHDNFMTANFPSVLNYFNKIYVSR